jgi:hypothetical protein
MFGVILLKSAFHPQPKRRRVDRANHLATDSESVGVTSPRSAEIITTDGKDGKAIPRMETE